MPTQNVVMTSYRLYDNAFIPLKPAQAIYYGTTGFDVFINDAFKQISSAL